MEYKLFEEFITLQALLKELGITHSGGAIKSFLSGHSVYFNGELENRRGKKLRIGDKVEKERIAKLVKEMNKGVKKDNSKPTSSPKRKQAPRFPGR